MFVISRLRHVIVRFLTLIRIGSECSKIFREFDFCHVVHECKYIILLQTFDSMENETSSDVKEVSSNRISVKEDDMYR